MDKRYLVFLAMGFELVALVVGFIYLGAKLDSQNNWPGYGVVGGAMIALVSWLIHLVVMAKSLNEDGPEDKGGKNAGQ